MAAHVLELSGKLQTTNGCCTVHRSQMQKGNCNKYGTITKELLMLCCACSAKLEQAGSYLVYATIGDAAVAGSPQHMHVFPAVAAADR